MRAWSLAAVVKSILSNLTVINIIFLILSILTVTNVVINVIVVPLLLLLLVLVVGVKGVHYLNHLFPMTGVPSIYILIIAWIGWAKTGSDWAHSLHLALILTISFIIRPAAGHFFLGGWLVNIQGHLSAAQSASQIFIRNIKISNDDIFNVLFSPFLSKILNSNVISRSIQRVGVKTHI